MARPPLGQESVDLAKERLRSSDSAREIRVCLAVILPTEQGLSINDTASFLGRSSRWVSHVRKLLSSKSFRRSPQILEVAARRI